jgi:hypothetical protein
MMPLSWLLLLHYAALSMVFLAQIMRRWEAITARNSAMKMRLTRPMEIIYQGTRMSEGGCWGLVTALLLLVEGAALCFGSGSGLDPDSKRSVDPDPGGQKITHNSRKI